MADNLPVTPGSGAVVAADDIGGGVLVQRVKNTFGVDGTATDVSAANPFPVTAVEVATTVSEGSVTLSAATAADIITATGTPCGMAIRNRGPNDATYRVGATATGAATERTLLVGEEKVLPYRTDKKISAISAVGTVIEWEQWS